MVSPTSKFCACSHVILSALSEEGVLLDTEHERFYNINEVGTRIWQLLSESPKSIDDIIETITQEYDISSEQAYEPISQFIDEIASRDLIRSV